MNSAEAQPTPVVPTWSLGDLLEGYHLASAVAFLHDEGLLDALQTPHTAAELATGGTASFDEEVLAQVIAYVIARTDIIETCEVGFVCAERYRGPRRRYLIDQYLGAYRPNAYRLDRIARDPSEAMALIDRRRHARAFSGQLQGSFVELIQLLQQLDVTNVLDLGCGDGGLLSSLAQHDQALLGWGLDSNPAMCTHARERLRAAGLDDRITIVDGDAQTLQAAIPPQSLATIEAVVAKSLINEFFRGGTNRAIVWLRKLAHLLAGRLLFVADYYGQLGYHPQASRDGLLHDFVQAISGQGVPPPNRDSWQSMYEAAGCNLLHSAEADSGILRFIHIVQLGPPPSTSS